MINQSTNLPIENYLQYQDKYYNIGTKVLCKTRFGTLQEGIITGINQRITINFKGVYETFSKEYINDYIVQIIDPVEVCINETPVIINDRVCPIGDDEFYGTLWYIIIMVIGTIFQDRIGIWLFATIVFFLWKNGYLKGGK